MWFFFVLFSTLCWAFVNVLDSLLVKHYEKNPLVLLWSQSVFSIPILVVLAFFLDLETPWVTVLLGMGMVALLGDLCFFHILDRLDVSVTNAAWPILSIFLSIAGFFIFGESWSLLQTAGAVLVIAGAMLLSLYHQHVSWLRTLCLLGTLGVLYLPYYVTKKAAVVAGENPLTVFYWMLIGRETLAFVVPVLFRKSRTRIVSLVTRMDTQYFLIGGAVIVCFFLAEYTGTLAYVSGPLSLVSIVSNVQPFVVIFLAWMLMMLFPSRAAKELFSRQSLGVKLISFCIVFTGLALLAYSQ